MNLYNIPECDALFKELCLERRNDGYNPFNILANQHLIKSWFAIVESTGGGVKSNENSERPEERCLFHIEKAIEIMKAKHL